ncbi:MAG: ankyrin repeat domain-containing protein [Candidatus Omnitrophica bacterium]|nr:ankyrin repeat domain-containing protein [Candidatus Omnitrophota bacterium]
MKCSFFSQPVVCRATLFGALILLIGCGGGDPFIAASNGKTGEVRRNLESNPGAIYSRDSAGRTLLHRAAENGQTSTVRYLLEQGAETETRDRSGWTALDYARLSGSEETVQLLEESVSLPEAVLRGDFELIDRLVSEDPNSVNQTTPEGATPLHFAVDLGDATLTEKLLQEGADPNLAYSNGESPLQRAIQAGDQEIVQLMLEAGADPNHLDSRGRSPIYAAIQRGDAQAVDLLLEHGANSNLELAEGLTPVQIAAQKGEIEIVKMILTRGGIIEAMNRDGRDALYWARKHGHYRLAHFIEEEIRTDDD